jgi:hypothetical protein
VPLSAQRWGYFLRQMNETHSVKSRWRPTSHSITF